MKAIRAVVSALAAAVAAGCANDPGARADPAFNRMMGLADFDHALLARAIFRETNRVRAENGAPPLGHMAALDDAADQQASYLALSLSVGHSNPFPQERNVMERVTHEGLDPASVGENAIMMPAARPPGSPEGIYTYATYAAFLLDGWMNSPEHRETLLSQKFTRLGCAARLARGFAQDDQRIFAVQEFLHPADVDLVSPEGTRHYSASPAGVLH